MVKTINVQFDNAYILEIRITGSDKLVKTLTEDIWFNSMIRDAIKELIKDKISKQIKEK